MRKLIALLTVSAILLSVGVCVGAESRKYSTSPKQALVDRNNDGKIDGVDIYDENGNVVKRGFDSDDNMTLDRWETYDENTGLPIVTESDAAFLLQ